MLRRLLGVGSLGFAVALVRAARDVLLPLKASELAKVVAATEAEARKHVAAYPHVHVTSSEKGMGIDELRAAVLSDAGV